MVTFNFKLFNITHIKYKAYNININRPTVKYLKLSISGFFIGLTMSLKRRDILRHVVWTTECMVEDFKRQTTKVRSHILILGDIAPVYRTTQ